MRSSLSEMERRGRKIWCLHLIQLSLCSRPIWGPNTKNWMLAQAMAARGDASQVLFLGTGCAEPSKYRGGAAVHVRLADGRGLLLDAGEGALGQLVRHFGPAGAAKQACVLKLLFVTENDAPQEFKT